MEKHQLEKNRSLVPLSKALPARMKNPAKFLKLQVIYGLQREISLPLDDIVPPVFSVTVSGKQ